ncbi:hypothetical protein [Psychrobacillus sp. OK032]|uniref:hypothetical protein n=1 Tax=Psychrobacillus sp. OK032 TaxID=1884358 RepID=UPI0008AAF4D6|nr:hypothetical protein [Psychrobacillus sp. OK032]SER71271.1 hypothetical protein SAMN05518872_101721 [Psychrobacillus sp. OK032]
MKKLKIFFIVALVIILGAGGYLLYMFKFKEYDVADEEVSEIVADPYKVELPDGSTLIIDEQGEVVVEETGSSENNTNTVTTSGSANSEKLAGKTAGSSTDLTSTENNTSGTTTTSSNEKPTVASIKDKYRPALEGLEAQADSKINALIGHAVSEYNGKKANGEKVDFGYFYNKYTAAAGNLEASTDTVFYAVIGAVEKDLAANGYDKSYAQNFKDEYEATKKARRDGILKKALGS